MIACVVCAETILVACSGFVACCSAPALLWWDRLKAKRRRSRAPAFTQEEVNDIVTRRNARLKASFEELEASYSGRPKPNKVEYSLTEEETEKIVEALSECYTPNQEKDTDE